MRIAPSRVLVAALTLAVLQAALAALRKVSAQRGRFGRLDRMGQLMDAMLEREGRTELARECFRFLPTRAALDLGGWDDLDIFAH